MKNKFLVIRKYNALPDDIRCFDSQKEVRNFLKERGTNFEIHKIESSTELKATIILDMI